MINKDKILITVFVSLIDNLLRSFFSSQDLTRTHLPNKVFLRNACALLFVLQSGRYESIYIVISPVTDMPPKKVPKLDNTQSQRKLSSFVSTNTESTKRAIDLEAGNNPGNNNANEGPSGETSNSSTTSRPSSDERKFQNKWLTLWPWLSFEGDAMFCKICLKHGKKNTMTSCCKTFKTSSMTGHEEMLDHKHANKSWPWFSSRQILHQ